MAQFNCRQTVIDIVGILEPGRAEAMRKTHLKRRTYTVKGPNHIWHVDGNDKLKRYGFAIHGAIDGFSRKIIWLEVADTNKKPEVVAKYFLNAVQSLQLIPRVVRMDRGTENFLLADLQSLFRSEHTDDLKHIASLFGSSNHNQRIERFWGSLRTSVLQIYMDIFADLEMSGLLDMSSSIELQCLSFCFMDVVVSELKEFMQYWNMHRMRKNKACLLPCGVPNFLYANPEHYDFSEQKRNLNPEIFNSDLCQDILNGVHQPPHSDFWEWGYTVMLRSNWTIPTSRNEAIELYGKLLSVIRSR